MKKPKTILEFIKNCYCEINCNTKIRKTTNLTQPDFNNEIINSFVSFSNIPCLNLDIIQNNPISIRDLRVNWKCPTCSHKYESDLRSKHIFNTICTKCANTKNGKYKITNSKKGILLKDSHPELLNQAIKLIRYPDIDPSLVSPTSGELMEWECRCGLHFESKIYAVTIKGYAACKKCKRTGKSLLEYEVAHLLRYILKIKVETHYKKQGSSEVDIYIPSLDFAIQLDPFWSHEKKLQSDINITKKLCSEYKDILRVRENPLPYIQNSSYKDISDTRDTEAWVKPIINYLNLEYTPLKPSILKNILNEAQNDWIGGVFVVKQMAYFDEFVKNITNPGRRIEHTPNASTDVCLWECAQCKSQWETLVQNRYRGSGCIKCGFKKSAQTRTNRIPEKNILIEDYPQIVDSWISNITSPNRLLEHLTSYSSDLVRWKCSEDGFIWEETISLLTNRTNPKDKILCKECAFKNSSITISTKYPFLVQYFSSNIKHTSRDLSYLKENSRDMCLWNCGQCSQEFERPANKAVNSALRTNNIVLCDICKIKPVLENEAICNHEIKCSDNRAVIGVRHFAQSSAVIIPDRLRREFIICADAPCVTLNDIAFNHLALKTLRITVKCEVCDRTYNSNMYNKITKNSGCQNCTRENRQYNS